MKRLRSVSALAVALLMILSVPAEAARIEALTANGASAQVFYIRGHSISYNAQVFGTWGNPTDAQDETSYDNSPTTEGAFVGGSGYAAADVITLSDGTTITVDNETATVVDQFTVDSSASTGAVAAATLTQSSVAPSGGTGFTLTPDADNITSASAKMQMRCGSALDAALPWGDMPFTTAPYAADAQETNMGFAECQIRLFLSTVGTATDLDFEFTSGDSETVKIQTP